MGIVRFSTHINDWRNVTEGKLDKVVLQIATDIHRVASLNAPVLTSALVKSGRIERIENAHYQIIFGGGSIKYAKMRHYVNNAHPNTLLYLERAGDDVGRNVGHYFGGL